MSGAMRNPDHGTSNRGLDRLQGRKAVTWRTLLGLLLVPLTVAGALLWGLWNPSERLDRMTAAVVNLDEPVDVDGQTVPMGRVLAAELIGGDADTNFTWELTDEADAASGLDEGRYTAVVTIPKSFSSDATSVSGGADAATVATIDVQTSERGRLLDSALANIVTTTATGLLNEQLSGQYVEQLLGGMSELGDGVSQAVDGASQLASGGSRLADGVDGLSQGASELAGGTSAFVNGVGELSTGAGGLADGTAKLADGTAELSTGVGKLAKGASKLSTGAGDLSSGAAEAATGGKTLSDGVKQYTQGANEALSGLQQGGGAAVEPLTQYRDAIAAGLIPMPSPEAQQGAIDGLNQLIGQLAAVSSDDPANPVNQLKAVGTELAQGAKASAEGQKQLASGAKQLAKGASELSDGLSQVADGAPALAKGAKDLASGTSEFAVGASQLASGGSQLATGTAELADGTEKLADGARQSADGAKDLAGSLGEAAEQVPSTSETQRTALAETMVRPVRAEGGSDALFNAAGVPLFVGIALWAGALAAFLVLAPLWRRTRDAARGVGFVALRSALPAVGLGALQGVIAGVVLPPLLGYDAGQWLGFFALAVVAGAAFALVIQGLSALLGGFGRFLAFALLAVAFAIGVVSTAPPLLQAIGDASPIGALFAGFQAAAMGVSGVGAALGALVL